MTEIYGASDDLIEFGGDFKGEIGYYYEGSYNPKGTLIFCDDGTVLRIIYGKAERAIWEITVIKRGSLFARIEICEDEDAGRYSDTAIFESGFKGAYVAKEWERVK